VLFGVLFGLVVDLHEVVQLVEQLFAVAVHLRVRLAHVLVERLVPVDGGLEGRDVVGRGSVAAAAAAPGRVGRRGRRVRTGAPLGDVLHILKLSGNKCQYKEKTKCRKSKTDYINEIHYAKED
jgi:hypothetical protein